MVIGLDIDHMGKIVSSDTALSPFKFDATAERANVSDCPKTPAMLEPVTPFLIRASWYAATFCSKLLDETDRLKKNHYGREYSFFLSHALSENMRCFGW